MHKITFDDGLLNTFDVAFPILDKHNIKATVFVVTGILTGELQQFRTMKDSFMNIDQLIELHDRGWEIGSHSCTHPRFDSLTLRGAKIQFAESKRYLDDNGFDCQSFAFPYGRHWKLEQIELAKMIYSHVRTTNEAPGCVHGIAIDKFPPKPIQDNEVYVVHRVDEPMSFEKWIRGIVDE